MGEDFKSKNKYLLKYLFDNADDQFKQKYIEYFKIELDWFLYNYGDHISPSHIRTKSNTLKQSIASVIRNVNACFFASLPEKSSSKNILSSVYSMSEQSLKNIGFRPYSSILQPLGLNNIIGDFRGISIVNKIEDTIHNKTFNDLNNLDLFYLVEELISILKKKFIKYNLRALLTYTGQYYSSKILFEIFQDLDRPTFIFSHGLPAIYSLDVDNNSDYLMVWGEKIKENYIKNGFSPDKIKVTGNPRYIKFDLNKKLKNSLDNILVIPCSSILWHQHEWGDPELVDRTLIITYLYQVQSVLSKLGIKKVRVRPHPSINKKWLSGFIDDNFYLFDTESLSVSLAQSTLVIGASSSTFLDSIIAGVNYIVFNPNPPSEIKVPPFDGSEKDLVTVTNEEELFLMIKDKYTVNPQIIDGYIQPLDLSILKKKIN